MDDRFACLDVAAEQGRFGDLVGIEKAAVSELVRRRIVRHGQSYREWLLAYCKRQREIAAGRGGEHQYQVAKAKARESMLKGDMLELQLAEKGGLVIPADETEKVIGAMIVATRTELLAMGSKLRERIKREHQADVPRETIDEYIHSALEHLATLGDGQARQLMADAEQSLAAAAESIDDGMGESVQDPLT